MFLTACSATSAPGSSAEKARDRPFNVTEIASFSTPWAMDFLPGRGNWALVSEREGKLWLVDAGNGQRLPVEGVPRVHVAGQGGLGDVVADPGFARNKRIYLTFVEAGPNGTSGAAMGYGTLENRGGRERLEKFRIVWRQKPKVQGDGHFSHRIAFGPDGLLYLTSGERQKFEPAQDLRNDLGKVLRLTPDGAAAPGNPFAKPGAGTRLDPAIWSYGHRNLLGIGFAPDGRLWAAEMGPKGGDELNLILPGRNYGWPKASNGSNYDGSAIPDHKPGDGFEPPKAWWTPSVSPGAMLIYTGKMFPAWQGDALLGALSGQAFIRVDLDGEKARKAGQWDMGARIRAVDQGPDGAVYLLEDEGRLLRLTPKA